MNRLNLIRNHLNQSSQKEDYSQFITVEEYSKNPKIKIVKLNNPNKLNALSNEFGIEIFNTLQKLDMDDNTKVIILTGTGKAFCAGANISKFTTWNSFNLNKNWGLHFMERIHYEINKPVIASVNGLCLGGGLELALSCDIIVASEKATFGFPEIKLGLIPGAGGTQKLTDLFGPYVSMEYILTGKNIPLDLCHKHGLVSHIVKHEELDKFTGELAESMCCLSLTTLIAGKKVIKARAENTLHGGIRFEKQVFIDLFNNEDKEIGVQAFLNKKKPVFKDK